MTVVHHSTDRMVLLHGQVLDALREMPNGSVNCVVTSPPYYGLRDYGVAGQIGAEATPAEHVTALRDVFAEVRRVLADDGTLWLNLGDSYAGSWGAQGKSPENAGMHGKVLDAHAYRHKASRTGARRPGMPGAKNLIGVPWRVAFALQDDGWILRNAVIWHKLNAMPEPVTDRLSNRYEHLFLFSKSRRYWFDLDPIREPLAYPGTTGHKFGGNSPDVGRRRGNTYRPDPTPYLGMSPQTARAATGECHQSDYGRGKNPGDVWSISTRPFKEAHFATYPRDLPERCILAGCKPAGVVLDPFSGSGTTGMVALEHGRQYVGIDLNAEYLDLSLRTRLAPWKEGAA